MKSVLLVIALAGWPMVAVGGEPAPRQKTRSEAKEKPDAPRKIGEKCSSDAGCASGRCVDGKCAAEQPVQ